jgi:hypothetical protein
MSAALVRGGAGGSIFGCLVMEFLGGWNQAVPHTDLSQSRPYLHPLPEELSRSAGR